MVGRQVRVAGIGWRGTNGKRSSLVAILHSPFPPFLLFHTGGTTVAAFWNFECRRFRCKIDPPRQSPCKILIMLFEHILGNQDAKRSPSFWEMFSKMSKCSFLTWSNQILEMSARYSCWNVSDLGSMTIIYIHLFCSTGGFASLLCGEIVLNWWKSWTCVSSCFVPANNSSEPHKRFQSPLSIRYSRGTE